MGDILMSEYVPPMKARIRTKYQRMSLAMRIAAQLRGVAEATPQERQANGVGLTTGYVQRMCRAIEATLASPFPRANQVLIDTPEVHALLVEVSKEAARI